MNTRDFIQYTKNRKINDIDINLLSKKQISDLIKNKHKYDVEYELWGKKYVIYCGHIKFYLIEWYPISETSYHGHPEKGCKFFVLQPGLTEYRKDNSKSRNVRIKQLFPGINYYIDDTIGYHKMRNVTNKNAYSIHIYGRGEFRQIV
jgi:hypothetical protein